MSVTDLGGRRPLTGQDFFNFIGFSENIIKILGWRPLPQGLTPPPRRSSGSAPGCAQHSHDRNRETTTVVVKTQMPTESNVSPT